MSRLAKRAMWSKRVAGFERCGLTRSAWCAREGLAVATLDYWRRQLRSVVSQAPVPIVVAQPLAKSARVDSGTVQIEVAGVRLRSGSDVDAEWLLSLLRGLR
ncbi:MAG: hypothetical protein SGI99_04830 [Pseudomonadota bacterium]|nr:hypothetical protein [Pseudomonadota bacterium]